MKNLLESCIPYCKKFNVISAFVTQSAIDWLSDLVKDSSPDVVLVGRFSINDFISGASSIHALRDCLVNGYKLKTLPNLHAKIYQIDSDLILSGSANFTGRGLALVEEFNLESCCRVTACNSSKSFIAKIIESAIPIDLQTLTRMEQYLISCQNINSGNGILSWPENILTQSTELFVSDFPLNKPGVTANEYSINESLPFAQIETHKNDFQVAAKLFKATKVFRWVDNLLINNNSGRDLGFGYISSMIHEKLADNPLPYRREIKDLQSNLYDYIRLYAADEVEIYIPGRFSEVLRKRL